MWLRVSSLAGDLDLDLLIMRSPFSFNLKADSLSSECERVPVHGLLSGRREATCPHFLPLGFLKDFF